jgi:crotonobetainyl-CoA:carnitine CoA-transferase CaiB-like acyl-CoA transferase
MDAAMRRRYAESEEEVSMVNGGALEGLRVLDLTDDSGRLAGKLLAEAGADVVRLRAGSPGPPMSGRAAERGGLLTWWYDAGTRRIPLALETADGQRAFRELAARADLLVETEPPGRMAARGIDYPDLRAVNPRLVHVSLTPFGRQGPRAGWQTSDLVSAALGGVLSVTGEPDLPLNSWGRQAFNVGGFFAAIIGLTGVWAARRDGQGQHIDLSLHECVSTCTEQVLMFWFFRDVFPVAIAPRQASLHWSGAYQVMGCRDGHVMITPTPSLPTLVAWLAEDGMADAVAEMAGDLAQVREKVPQLMAALRSWAATKDAHGLFLEAQRRHLPFGEVLSVAEVAASPQLTARGFFRPVAWDGPVVRTPGPLIRMEGTPPPPAQPPPATPSSAEDVLAEWVPRPTDLDAGTQHSDAERDRPAARGNGQWVVGSGEHVAPLPTADCPLPLAGIRVLDFTWVLAGPYATRILADLGADVVKIQTETRSQGASGNEHPYFVMWNRNKRSVALNIKHPRAIDIFRSLVERSDIVIDNFSAGVLDRWGIGYEAARRWNERIIYLNLTGVGRDGPWRDFVTYAPTIHALSGLTYLTNPPGRRDIGLGLSLNDHASGLAGALAALEALEARQRTGTGTLVDLSQLEVGTYLAGPAYLDLLANGREAHPQGNRDPFDDVVPNEVYRCRGDDWLAITARDDQEWRRLCEAIADTTLGDDPCLAGVEGRRRQRALIDERLARWCADQDADAAMRRLQAAGVPAGIIQNARTMTEADEQLGPAGRDWFTEVTHPVRGRHPIDRFSARFSRPPLETYAPAPVFGEHTFDVYRDLLGLSDEQIAEAIGDGLLT